MTGEIIFKVLTQADWDKVAEIYKQGIETGNSTFQYDVPAWDEWDKGHLKACRLVGELNGRIVGWAALSPVSSRCVYAGVAEVSVYVLASHRGLKIGWKLLKKLVEESEKNDIWTLQAGIFPENISSVKIHESMGFRQVGYREKIGKLNGIWRDALLLERRSKTAGTE